LRRLCLVLLGLVALVALPAAGGSSRGRPRVAIFYYPWYGNMAHDGRWIHWNQNGHQPPADLASQYYPARGAYSSGDPRVVAAQMGEIAGTGIGEIIVSWWGRGSEEDQRLPLVIRAATKRRLEVAIHLEPYDNRTLDSVTSDITYLQGLGIRDIFVYDPFTLPDAGWMALNSQLKGVRLFAATGWVRRAAKDGFTGVYTYDVADYRGFNAFCAAARQMSLLCAPSVGPGFDARRAGGSAYVRPRRGGATYDGLWHAAIGAHPDLVTITSYNEWHEGTQIEPARPLALFGGRRYGTYNGAWGLHGHAASDAYLLRTAYWVARFG
jgi:glycoprotein endo-alpha-1,2-mannosidase